MSCAMVSVQSWAEVVKGKENSTCPTTEVGMKKTKKKFNAASAEFVPRTKATSGTKATSDTEEKFSFNAEAPEFSLPLGELKMNASAREFVPPAAQGLNPFTKEFVPPEHKLLTKAAQMQKLLLECYTDDDASSDDEPDEPARPVVQKPQPARKIGRFTVVPFRAPPGLAPPGAALNPLAEAFDPSRCCANGKIGSPAPAFTSAINLTAFDSEDEDADDESISSTPRDLLKLELTSVHGSTSAGESSDSEPESP